MSPAAFLHAFVQALSAINLYRDGHPARARAEHRAWEALHRLQEQQPRLHFTFIGDEVLCGAEPLRELADWDWSKRLAAAGIQRMEFDESVEQDDFDAFLEEVVARLTALGGASAEQRQMRQSRIRIGALGMKGDAPPAESDTTESGAQLSYALTEEADTLRWLHEQVQEANELHLTEAEAVVRSLTLAMHGDRQLLIPLLRLRNFDEYTTTHALNVSVLAMALAEHLGLGRRDVRAFGVAGLLHDVGKVRIPRDILTKPGKLSDEERAIMNSHTVEGARILIQTEQQLELAAVVAYEHHIMIDGGGYPSLHYRRDCHYASRIVHVCDVYDALRTKRPYRDAWPAARVSAYIEEKAGTEFDAAIAHAFLAMMQAWEPRIATLDESGALLPGGPPAS